MPNRPLLHCGAKLSSFTRCVKLHTVCKIIRNVYEIAHRKQNYIGALSRSLWKKSFHLNIFWWRQRHMWGMHNGSVVKYGDAKSCCRSSQKYLLISASCYCALSTVVQSWTCQKLWEIISQLSRPQSTISEHGNVSEDKRITKVVPYSHVSGWHLQSAPISISHHKSASISINQHQSAPIWINQQKSAPISLNQYQSATISIN